MRLLNNYGWPGNVRQLKNVVNRMVILNPSEITESLVMSSIGVDKRSKPGIQHFSIPVNDEILTLKEIEKEFRKEYVQFIRKNCRTDAEAAEKLGFAPPNYHRLCKEIGLK